jgi:hypothetical protein
VLWLDTALVVPPEFENRWDKKPSRFSLDQCFSGGKDYQSCVEPQHSKGFADLSDFAKALLRLSALPLSLSDIDSDHLAITSSFAF